MAANEIPKAYDPKLVEDQWYARWLAQGCFTANPHSAKPAYSIVIPPPNVTGVLTMGHVLNNTLQDILARRKRMQGFEVLWLPGTDHAGIATQTVVEKTLRKQGVIKHRNDLGREKFLTKIWEWKDKHGGIIIQQLKKLGCSCDWTRERFTMDEAYSQCVLRVFVALYDKGLIYRGKRMVNWCPVSRTALSDEEVIMKEVDGHLWHIKYPLLDPQGRPHPHEFLVVATTRPETMLGDEAVAVNPDDPRYRQLIGRKLSLPLKNKQISVIADAAVDPKFGTGCVKVTPAHDVADYEMALRHQLPVTVVIGPDGVMTEEAGEPFAGLDRMEARDAVVKELEEDKLLLKVEPYRHNVGYSERADVPIEPYLSEQWFLKYPEVARSTQAVDQGEIRFYPERWTKTYTHWMTGIKDWCISRQLWWGHRIPVWNKHFDDYSLSSVYTDVSDLLTPPPSQDHRYVGVDSPAVAIVIDGQRVTADSRKLMELGLKKERLSPGVREIDAQVCTFDPELIGRLQAAGWEQDSDVLDTWFSSWLWPFATMGWPEQTPTLAKFYPTTDLVTGPDIIFFWVARMIMAGYEFQNAKPFGNVYFTGIIRDAIGRKMSKSLGNSPDPLDLIAKYGADGLRFGLMLIAPQGQDILFDEKRCEVGRNFMNKLWNAARFIQMQRQQGGTANTPTAPDARTLSAHDRKILFEMNQAIQAVTAALDGYKFNEAAKALYDFVWGEFCDWYLEASKVALNIAVLDEVFAVILRLLHPFTPFITEELWQGMGYGTATIQFESWPAPRAIAGATAEHAALVDALHAVVRAGRQLRNDYNIEPRRKVEFAIKPSTAESFFRAEAASLEAFLGAEKLTIDPQYAPAGLAPSLVTPSATVFLVGAVDVAAERARLTKQLQDLDRQLTATDAKLANKNFVAKAAPIAVEREREKQKALREQREKVLALMRSL